MEHQQQPGQQPPNPTMQHTQQQLTGGFPGPGQLLNLSPTKQQQQQPGQQQSSQGSSRRRVPRCQVSSSSNRNQGSCSRQDCSQTRSSLRINSSQGSSSRRGDGDLSVQHKEQPQNPNPTMMQEVPDPTAPQIPLPGDLQQTGLSGPQVANEQLVAAEGRNWGLC